MKWCSTHNIGVVISIVLLLPGCGKVVDWGRTCIDQGQTIIPQSISKARTYMRSMTVYDQFETVGMFDALWVSEEVRTAYVHMLMHKHGASAEHEKAMLRRCHEEGQKGIYFYVLNRYTVPLGEVDAPWSILLQVDGQTYQPTMITPVDLAPEYRYIFGERCTRFKQAYRIVFDAYDYEGKPIITPMTRSMALCFRSLIKQACLEWRVPGGISPREPDEDTYHQTVAVDKNKRKKNKKRRAKRIKKMGRAKEDL